MMDLFQKKYIRFAIAAVIYLLVVIWIGNYWLLAGLAVIFDLYVTEKVNWTFWKKRNGTNSAIIEWLDALIFAVIAVTLINIFLFQNYRIPTPSMEKSLLVGDHLFVSKIAYGPRMPNTPLAFPFTQHTMPITKGKSWSNLIQWPYKRLKGFGTVKRNDPIVFNFPAGDTVVVENQVTAYYEIVRSRARELQARYNYTSNDQRPVEDFMAIARKEVRANSTIIYRPVDRRDNYVKRCVGVPGDTILIKSGVLYVNGGINPPGKGQQTTYFVKTNGTSINPRALERLDISRSDQMKISGSVYQFPLTSDNADAIAKFTNVTSVTPVYESPGRFIPHIFPHKSTIKWNEDNFGPLWIPSKGSTVSIDTSNICLYDRIIDVYEDNDFRIEGSNIYINGKLSDSYTFKMDYYWMMGDNRHNSADSRYWGFVPEDHIVGKPKFIWLSLNKEAKGFKKIRLGRMFMGIK
ncbi:MAG TPA: S26 family signal peptidase [Bacteroidales bacterium]|nr:S26 family signal peptidase [Bacteroidales bacterium]HPJ60763.1 S26 family signal peptidase [Bacteroidales bacterium]HPR13547.1 S26 family signal peptidase [Bacteroidales bacterium]HRW86595.1 S26 family signal peptidase [Bacteroidales bacterium]